MYYVIAGLFIVSTGLMVFAAFSPEDQDQDLKDKEIELHMRSFEKRNRRSTDNAKFEVLK